MAEFNEEENEKDFKNNFLPPILGSFPPIADLRLLKKGMKERKESKGHIRRKSDPSHDISTPLIHQFNSLDIADKIIQPPLPSLPSLCYDLKSIDHVLQMSVEMKKIQDFIESFEYNYTSTPFYAMKKTGGTCHIFEIYNQIISRALPIQCVEAVFLATVLTAPWSDGLIRLPLSFKSKFQRVSLHRHIVLAVQFRGLWGALGISRREGLMFKPLKYASLWELLEDFCSEYVCVGHSLLAAYVGPPLPKFYSSNTRENSKVIWKALKLKMTRKHISQSQQDLSKFLTGISL